MSNKFATATAPLQRAADLAVGGPTVVAVSVVRIYTREMSVYKSRTPRRIARWAKVGLLDRMAAVCRGPHNILCWKQ